MASADPGDDEPLFKTMCKEETVRKIDTLNGLVEATHGFGRMDLASLVPVGNVMKSIVEKDRASFDRATDDMKLFIGQKKEFMRPSDLPLRAEINFLEAFTSFLSYIHTGNAPEDDVEEVDTNTQSLNSSIDHSPAKNKIRPKRRAAKRLDETKEAPVRKSARFARQDVQVIEDMEEERKGEEEKQQMRPTRKSTRIEDVNKFNCVFNGCTEFFHSHTDLESHAEECMYKSNMMLVFRCETCKTDFLTDKSVKTHFTQWNFKCSKATITIHCVEKEGEEELEGGTILKDTKPRRESVTNENEREAVSCPANECNYAHSNIATLYSHVKNLHADCNTIFECLNCGDEKRSGNAMSKHITQMCKGAKTILKLCKTKDQEEVNSTELLDSNDTLGKCPIDNCGFTTTAPYLGSHFKRIHWEKKMSYRCSKCYLEIELLKTVMDHCKECIDSQPEIVVNDRSQEKKTPRRAARQSMVPAPTMEMRKRERPLLKSSAKKVERKAKVEIDNNHDDMPVLEVEVITLDDEVMEEMERVKSMDVSSKNKRTKKVKNEIIEDHPVYMMSDSDESSDL